MNLANVPFVIRNLWERKFWMIMNWEWGRKREDKDVNTYRGFVGGRRDRRWRTRHDTHARTHALRIRNICIHFEICSTSLGNSWLRYENSPRARLRQAYIIFRRVIRVIFNFGSCPFSFVFSYYNRNSQCYISFDVCECVRLAEKQTRIHSLRHPFLFSTRFFFFKTSVDENGAVSLSIDRHFVQIGQKRRKPTGLRCPIILAVLFSRWVI